MVNKRFYIILIIPQELCNGSSFLWNKLFILKIYFPFIVIRKNFVRKQMWKCIFNRKQKKQKSKTLKELTFSRDASTGKRKAGKNWSMFRWKKCKTDLLLWLNSTQISFTKMKVCRTNNVVVMATGSIARNNIDQK
jgi:hypothetical protein